MGISGLLPLLSPITHPIHLKDLSGLKIAVDVYVWLHRGAFGCAMDLCVKDVSRKLSGNSIPPYVAFCMKRIQLLQSYNISPVLVFDGGCLPMKSGTEKERRRRRKESRKRGLQELALGNKTKAMEYFQHAVDITPFMASMLIEQLRKEKIDFIVAPYEADAQLAYLEKIGYVSAVLSEDSDLVVFGCQRVILKLDASGNAVEVRAKDLGNVPQLKRGWTFDKFRQACILSGCDYVSSLKGVGLKKAIDAIAKYGSMEKAIQHWKNWGKLANAPTVRSGYLEEVVRAEQTFLYQRVFDPIKREIVHLTPLTDGHQFLDEMSFLGPYLEPSTARGVAEGFLNPYTKRDYGDKDEQSELSDDENVPVETVAQATIGSDADKSCSSQEVLSSSQDSFQIDKRILEDATNKHSKPPETVPMPLRIKTAETSQYFQSVKSLVPMKRSISQTSHDVTDCQSLQVITESETRIDSVSVKKTTQDIRLAFAYSENRNPSVNFGFGSTRHKPSVAKSPLRKSETSIEFHKETLKHRFGADPELMAAGFTNVTSSKTKITSFFSRKLRG